MDGAGVAGGIGRGAGEDDRIPARGGEGDDDNCDCDYNFVNDRGNGSDSNPNEARDNATATTGRIQDGNDMIAPRDARENRSSTMTTNRTKQNKHLNI